MVQKGAFRPGATLAAVCRGWASKADREANGRGSATSAARLREACAALSGAGPVLLGAILLSGCASPGNPRPPSLHLQQVPAAAEAQRLGDQVIVTWDTPAGTTDGGKPEPPLTAVVCREMLPQAARPATAPVSCTPVLRLAAAPGSSGRAAETLPAALLATPALLAYRVELLNARGRSAGLSPPAFAAAGPAPAPAGPLTLSGRADGTLIAWAGVPSPGFMQVTRMPASPAPARQTANPPGRRTAPAPADDPQATLLLRPPDRTRADRGVVDASVLDPRAEGVAFRYVAQRVETVTLGGHTLELDGIPSPPAVFTYAYTFAPPPPSGLLAVPTLSPPEIDLSWEPAEPASAAGPLGYNIYRRGPGESSFTLLNAKPVASPSFRDPTVTSGRPYTYRVTALDRHGNQSAPSPEVQEIVTP